jgi:hypothetical protein
MLEISRNDISSTEIDQSGSHLPFDVIKFMQHIIIKDDYGNPIELTPISPQIAMINAYLNPNYRFIVGCLSRRTGKTLIANVLGLLVTLIPDMNVLIMSPNYNLSLISYELQRKFIKAFGLELIRDNAKDRLIEISNGSSIRMGSVNQVDSAVGRSYQLIIFDEAALTNKGQDAYNVALRPTLDRKGSKCLFISTPRGKNWFYDFYMRGFSENTPEWASIHSDYKENPRVLDSDITEARITMSKAQFAQEYLAEFNELEGAVYTLSSDCIIPNLKQNLKYSEYDVIIGVDVGFRDPTAMVVILIDIDEHIAYIIDEYQKNEKTSSKYAEALLKFEEEYDPDVIFVDSANAQMRYDWAQDYDLSTRPAKKSKLDGIAFVGSFIDNDRLKIDASCTGVINAIETYQWRDSFNSKEEFTREDTLHNDASHYNDALRYALYSYSQNII